MKLVRTSKVCIYCCIFITKFKGRKKNRATANFRLGVPKIRKGNSQHAIQRARLGRNLQVNRVDEKKDNKEGRRLKSLIRFHA